MAADTAFNVAPEFNVTPESCPTCLIFKGKDLHLISAEQTSLTLHL